VWKPSNLQICDPVRPTTAVSGGPGRRRWEFMRLPRREHRRTQHRRDRVAAARPVDLTPDNATLERHTRVHVPGPLGRPLARGTRPDRGRRRTPDAAVRRTGACARASGTRPTSPGSSNWSCPDNPTTHCSTTYGSERSAHGPQRDRDVRRTRQRDLPERPGRRPRPATGSSSRPAATRPARCRPCRPPSWAPACCTPTRPAPRSARRANSRRRPWSPTRRGEPDRLDQITGARFVIATGRRPRRGPQPRTPRPHRPVGGMRGALHASGRRARRGHARPCGARPHGGGHRGLPPRHLRATGHEVAVIRPDHYLFGAVASASALPDLLMELASRLHLRDTHRADPSAPRQEPASSPV